MFEQLMTLMFLAPAAPSGTWAAADAANVQGRGSTIRLEVSGPARAGCAPQTLALPPVERGALRFEDRGLRYTGTETVSGNLLVRSDGARPLTLSGSRVNGGLWSLGNDGRCVGRWKLEDSRNAARR
ncbi:MAG TPA: hypothetical protein VJ890_09085 [Vineibacter sp.]|nr:hypothetical protein [Vineibacter sp.]